MKKVNNEKNIKELEAPTTACYMWATDTGECQDDDAACWWWSTDDCEGTSDGGACHWGSKDTN